MKLSDAIATGRVLLKPYSGYLLVNGDSGCALGMAALGAGLELVSKDMARGDEYQENYERIHRTWPWLIQVSDVRIDCPCCSQAFIQYSSAITHIFDRHVSTETVWTLDQLIDWVRSVEPADLPAEPLAAAPAEQQVETLQTVPGPISNLREERKASHVHHERAVTKLVHVPSTDTRTERSL